MRKPSKLFLKKKADDFTKQSVQEQPSKKESFVRRRPSEIHVYQQIKQKNQMIKQRRALKQQINKPKVKTLTQSFNGGSTGCKGFTHVITLSLIISFVCGALFMIVYMLIRR